MKHANRGAWGTPMTGRVFTATIVLLALAPPAAAEPLPFMMSALVESRLVEGQPLSWSAERVLLLGRDGALYDFAAADAEQAKRTANRFAPYSNIDMQARLREEFGPGWDATATAHFVAVHPTGAWSAWAERLERLYGNFVRYMQVRGIRLKSPATPLVAVVFRNQSSYFAYARAQGRSLPAGTLGHYDPATNRIYLYDSGNGDADSTLGGDTIIHEATHQAAYNTGVHTRFAEQPRWLVEGLAMMFESPGVWNPGPSPQRADRLNRYRLTRFRTTAGERSPQWIAELVASDRNFTSDVLTAYAEAWMLSFYLSETQPQQYSYYLRKVAARPLFAEYPPADRVRDFAGMFGNDYAQLAAQVQQFVDRLP